MQRIWVQLCGKNRHKVIILFMHKRKRGKWVFIDMIKGGLLALLTRFYNSVFNEGGGLRFRLHVYRANNKQRMNLIAMLKHMINIVGVMFMVTMCWQFHLKESN